MKLKINENISIRSKEINYKSIKSTGPGGQSINKSCTAISLHFDISNSDSISNNIKAILLRTPNKYLTKSGKLIIKVNTYKSQKRNKSEAILRLKEYFENSIFHKKRRIKTSPKKSSIEKRLDDKRKNSFKKRMRKIPNFE